MYLLFACCFIGLGLFMIILPQIFYSLTEKWKTSSDSDPSPVYLFSTRFGGIMFILVGIGSIVAQFIA